MGFQYFIDISRFHIDFKISMRFHRISQASRSDFDKIPVFYGNNRKILLGILDLRFKTRFQFGFSICVQDFSLLRTPRP